MFNRSFYVGVALSFAILLSAVLIVLLVDYNPTFENPKEEIDFSMHYARYQHADDLCRELSTKNDFDTKAHHYWISTHFKIPEAVHYLKEPGSKGRSPRYTSFYRDDQKIIHYFKKLADTSYRELNDRGKIALAACCLRLNQLPEAKHYLSKVYDIDLPYYNSTLGIYYLRTTQNDSAELCLKQEVYKNGPNQIAYRNLAQLYLNQGDSEKLCKLVDDEKVSPYLTYSQREHVYFNRFNMIDYWISIVSREFTYWNIFNFIGAALIAFFWGFYLYKIDLYEPERIRYVLLAFLMGCFSVFITELLSDMNHFWLGNYLNGELSNDFMYSVLGIGVIEELSKAIPLLVMIYGFKQVNEPYDYIKYICLSAVGFSFVENVMYIDNYGMNIIHSRMIFSCFGHVVFSSVVGYLLALNHYRWQKPWFFIFMVGVFVAAFAHGFFDFWLINEQVKVFSFLSLLLIALSIFIFHAFVNSALNNSDFFDREKIFDNVYYTTILIVGSTIVYAYEYISVFLLYGFDYGLDAFYKMVSYFICMYITVFIVVVNRINVVPKKWLHIFHLVKRPRNRLESELSIGVTCRLKKFTKNSYQQLMLPSTGEVIGIHESNDRCFYTIKLPQSFDIDMPVKDRVVIKLKENLDTGDNLVAFFVIPSEAVLSQNELTNFDLKFCGWARLEMV